MKKIVIEISENEDNIKYGKIDTEKELEIVKRKLEECSNREYMYKCALEIIKAVAEDSTRIHKEALVQKVLDECSVLTVTAKNWREYEKD